MLQQTNNYSPNIHHRCSICLKGYDYSQAGLYFVTICVQNHQCVFGEIKNGESVLNDFGKIIENEWHELKNKYPYIVLHEYIVMQNHFHDIVEISATNVGAGSARPSIACPSSLLGRENSAPIISFARRADPAPTLGNIIGYFKYQTTKKLIYPLNYGNAIIMK